MVFLNALYVKIFLPPNQNQMVLPLQKDADSMATYHFRIKNDKKPDGTRISAVTHAEYVGREGKFSNIDRKESDG